MSTDLTADDVREISEAADWALGLLRRFLSAAAESPDFAADIDQLLLDLEDGMRAEPSDADGEPQGVLDGVAAGGFLQMREAVAKLAAYDRLFGEVDFSDVAEPREIGNVHDSSPSLAGLNNLSVGDGPVSGGDPAGPGHPRRGGAR
jgi:hypothetical protein